MHITHRNAHCAQRDKYSHLYGHFTEHLTVKGEQTCKMLQLVMRNYGTVIIC